MELGAVVAEESVFCGDPEESLLILKDFEDVEIAETFVLAVVMEGELLCSRGYGYEKADQEQQPLDRQGLRCIGSTSLGPSGTAQHGPRTVLSPS